MSFKLGIDNLLLDEALFHGQRVGLLSHQPATCTDGRTSAQALRAVLGERFVRIFGPEHGYFCAGGAGEAVHSCLYPAWGIPVESLYGERRHPPPELLQDLDIVVVDLQDIGARCYTYLATMRYMLEACASAGVKVVVCDRPVPLASVCDGPMLDPGFESFVAGADLPMCHGMTPGESALWLKRNGSLTTELEVIPMQGYRRDPCRGVDWPEWIPPSPGIRTWESAMCYLATVFSEGLPAIDCGRGSGLAFRLFGGEGINNESLCDLLNGDGPGGVAFTPHRYESSAGVNLGELIDGVRLCVNDAGLFQPVTTSVAIMWALCEHLGSDFLWGNQHARPEFFDKLYGTSSVREMLASGCHWREVVAGWLPGIKRYLPSRAEVLLYGEDG